MVVQHIIQVRDLDFRHRPASHKIFPSQHCACTCYSSVMHDCCLIRSLVEDNKQVQTTTGLPTVNNQTTVITVSVSTAVVLCTLIITGFITYMYVMKLRSKQHVNNQNSAQRYVYHSSN